MKINALCIYIYEAVRYWYKPCPVMIQSGVLFHWLNPYFHDMVSQKLKYLLLIVLLHAAVSSCNISHEIMRLDYSQSGCFGGYSAQLLIYEKQGELMVRVEFDNKLVRTAKMSKAQLEFFTQFVKELKNYREPQCYSTTSTTYRFVSWGETFRRESTCGFRDFNDFYKELFAS